MSEIIINIDENSSQTAKDYAAAAKAQADRAEQAKPLDSLSPTDVPDGVGLKTWNAVEPGPYPNCGGIVIPENCFAIIKRDATGAFSFTKTDIELGAYSKKSDIIDALDSTATDKPLSAKKGKELNEKAESSLSITKDIKAKELDGHYFTDKFGNVMFEIGVDGAESTSYKIINPITKEVVVSLNKDWYDNLISSLSNNNIKTLSKPDGFYYTDSFGNVIAKLTSSGFQAIKFIDKTGEELSSSPKKLDDKLVVSLGDSHTNSPWLAKFCQLTGSTSNTALQNYAMANLYNYTDSGLMMGQAKAVNQYCVDNDIIPDVILIENCHFKNDGVKPITDYVPMIYDDLQIYGTTYGSYTSMVSNIDADKADFIASLTPKVKTALRFNYSTFKHTITFSSAGALTAGTIQLTIDGSVFPINVSAGQTLAQAVTALNDWALNVTNWTNSATKGGVRTNTIELVYTGTSVFPLSPEISFTAGGTGMTMTSNDLSSAVSYQDYYFNSLILSDWTNADKWVATNGTTTYPAMMGLIEYLKDKFPLAEIIVWAVQFLQVSNTSANANSYMVETFTGSGIYVRNIHKYYENSSVSNYLKSKEAMRITASYYNCRFLDVDTNCGINLFNLFDGYYSENDLHPLPLGYEKWGETLAKLY